MRELLDKYVFSNVLRQQVVVFLLVGGLCYIINLILLIFLVEVLYIEVNLANLLSSLVAIYIAYILNGRFIFKRGKHSPAKEISAFFLFSFLGLLINIFLMFILTTYTPIWYVISKTIVTIMVAAFNFMTRKFFVFNG